MYSNEAYLLEQLQENGLITERDIQQAKTGLKPGESAIAVLIKSGAISDEQIARMVAYNSGMEYFDLNGFAADPGLKALVPLEVALKYKIVPLGVNQTSLQIAVADPYDFETLDALPHLLQPDIEYFCSTPALIKTTQSNVYGNEAVMGTSVTTKGGDGTVAAEDAPEFAAEAGTWTGRLSAAWSVFIVND